MIWDSFLSQKIVYKKLKVTHLFSTIEKKTDNLPHLLSTLKKLESCFLRSNAYKQSGGADLIPKLRSLYCRVP